jgi:hypothetical protein
MDQFVAIASSFLKEASYRRLNIIYTRDLTRGHLHRLFQLHVAAPTSSTISPLTSITNHDPNHRLGLRRFALAIMCLLVPVGVTEPSLAHTIDLLHRELKHTDM